MDPLIIPLEKAKDYPVTTTGSKAFNLSLFLNQGFKVPKGFSISSRAYHEFIEENGLAQKIDAELNRKSGNDMRWEEIWDASLRIRSAFLRSEINPHLEAKIMAEIEKYKSGNKFSVRSSSPTEDSAEHSFAGIHESYINIKPHKLIESIKLVWASLWSDRSILYRNELQLDPLNSTISVLVQKMVEEPISGLAFSQNPTGQDHNQIIEAVPGLCSDLVDNLKEPEEWRINPHNNQVIEHRSPPEYKNELLNHQELINLSLKLKKIEKYFQNPVDVEWTGTGANLTVLQVRPITSVSDPDEDRQWYLTLTPHFEKLKNLAEKVENELIPQLESEGRKLSQVSPQNLGTKKLAYYLKERAEAFFKWKDIYWDDFIPLAHGIRNFGTYYNDLVKPTNPYQFMDILKTPDILANQRNQELQKLHQKIESSTKLNIQIKNLLSRGLTGDELVSALQKLNDSSDFYKDFKKVMNEYMDVSYANQSLNQYPEIILRHINELKPNIQNDANDKAAEYLMQLYQKAGPKRQKEADEILRIGRLSWKLRDDDNLLLGRLESQLLKFLQQSKKILQERGQLLEDSEITPEDWEIVYQALLDSEYKPTKFASNKKSEPKSKPKFEARQIVGQPSSPGLVTGIARIVTSIDDFKALKKGEILVVDAVEPQMTFLVSLAAGIVERRGGMLVHSSIIAREMGIPAVNGVSHATEYIKNGQLLTVNGYLGIVVIGEAEFNLELEDNLSSSTGPI